MTKHIVNIVVHDEAGEPVYVVPLGARVTYQWLGESCKGVVAGIRMVTTRPDYDIHVEDIETGFQRTIDFDQIVSIEEE